MDADISTDDEVNSKDLKTKETQPSPKTFVELYKLACKLSNDPSEEHIVVYQDLDNLMKFIKEHPDSEALKYSISDIRVCVVIPYEMFKDKRRLPDDVIDGEDVIFACPGYDTYVSLIIDQINNDYLSPMNKNRSLQTKWKLAKLNLALTDWDAYVKRYLKPFESSQAWHDYLLSFLIKK